MKFIWSISQTQVNESKWLLLRIDKYLLKIYFFHSARLQLLLLLFCCLPHSVYMRRGHEKLPDIEYHQREEKRAAAATKND